MNIVQLALNFSFSCIANKYYNNFQSDIKKAGKINRNVLAQILKESKNSEYGLRYNFENIDGSEDYKRQVPVTNYSDYEKYIERIARGEQNILTCENVEFFGLSSGTTGKQKFIPVTSKARGLSNSYMNFLNQGLIYNAIPSAKKGSRGLFLISMSKPALITSAGIPAGAGTSEGIKAMKSILPYMWTSPIEVLEIQDQQTSNYLHALFVLQDKNLSYIASPFPSNIVQFFGVMKENWGQLVKDIAAGTIGKHLKLESEVRTLLEKKLKPNPKRAAELKIEFAKGIEGIAARIWPSIQYVSCVAGGSFSIYINKLRGFIGELPIYSTVYGATEALIGMAVKPDTVNYVVVPRTVYFEFMPLSEQDSQSPITLDLDELKIGESYEILITNYSGFYRYRLGDIVKVVDYYGESPVIEFLYRKGQLLNIATEKTQESAVQHSMMTVSKKMGVELVDYTVTQDISATLGYYKFYVEVNNSGILLNNIQKYRDMIEEELGKANPTYLSALKSNKIAPLKLNVVRPGTFQELRGEFLNKGASINQVKVPRVVNDEKLILLLEGNIERRGELCGKELC